MSRLASTRSLVRTVATSLPGSPDPHSPDDHHDSPGGDISPIKRAAVRTMDLGRSFTSRPRSPTMTIQPESKRALSLKRKDAGREAQDTRDQAQGEFSPEKCSRMSSLLKLPKALLNLPCHPNLMDYKAWIMYTLEILLRLSRMMIHLSLHLRRQPLHPYLCWSLLEISVRCVWYLPLTLDVWLTV